MTERLDAATARRWFTSALARLAAARASLDALNLFPVPDADTGSNVVRTLTAGARRAQECAPEATLSDLTSALADGALWGARGNSGVILAQSLQAIAQTFDGMESAGADDLIRAFDALASAARAALAHPVEGTIVTVARAIADATVALPPEVELPGVLDVALAAAYDATARTTDQLPELRGTGKVDAGAVCLTIIVEALAEELGVPTHAHSEWLPDPDRAPTGEDIAGYEVMYLLRATQREAADLRRHLDRVGEAVVVVRGAGDLWHVHVHLEQPAQALAAGELSQVVCRNLDSRAALGAVAATTAPGLLEPLAALGAISVLDAGPRTLARALQDADRRDVLMFPCSAASEEAARRAADDPSVVAEDIAVTTAPTRSNLGVLEALLHLQSTRSLDGMPIPAEASLTSAAEPDIARAAGELAAAGGAVLTVLVGADPRAADAGRRLVAAVEAVRPDIECFTIEGGQAETLLEASVL